MCFSGCMRQSERTYVKWQVFWHVHRRHCVKCVAYIGDLAYIWCVCVCGLMTVPCKRPVTRFLMFLALCSCAHVSERLCLCMFSEVRLLAVVTSLCVPSETLSYTLMWWSGGLTQFLSLSQTAGCQWPQKPQTHDKPQMRASVRTTQTHKHTHGRTDGHAKAQ